MSVDEEIERLRALINERVQRSKGVIDFVDDLLSNHKECLNAISGLGDGDPVFFEFGGLQFYRGISCAGQRMYCVWVSDRLNDKAVRALCVTCSSNPEEDLMVIDSATGSLWWDKFKAVRAKKDELIAQILDKKKKWEENISLQNKQDEILDELRKEADLLHIMY